VRTDSAKRRFCRKIFLGTMLLCRYRR
jgi:hypothetical protein